MASGTLVSEQEYLSTTYKPSCDYIDGVLRHKAMPTRKHSRVQGKIVYLIYAGFPDFEANPELTLKIRTGKYYVPDVAIQRIDRLQDPYAEAPVHVCVEILSPDDRFGEIVSKCEDYLAWGVEMTWIIDPEALRAWEYRKGQRPVEIPPDGSLTAEGISLRLADIFKGL
jgi:Uma2 family endonuclease